MSGWTPERIELLRKFYLAGLSASQIAERIGGGLSRNAVIGKAHRLGIGRDRKAQAATSRAIAASMRPRKKAPKHERHPWKTATGKPKPPTGTGLTVAEIQPLNLRIFDDGFGGCRWPTGGEGEQTTFCCLPRPGGKAYCAAHAKLAFRIEPPSKLRRIERLARHLTRAA